MNGCLYYCLFAQSDVIRQIDADGAVGYADFCKAKIDNASYAYKALCDTLKKPVANAQRLPSPSRGTMS